MLFAGLIWFDYLNFLEWQRTFGTLGVVSENLKHTGLIFSTTPDYRVVACRLLSDCS